MNSLDKCSFIIFKQFYSKIAHSFVLDYNIRLKAANHQTQLYKIVHSATRFDPTGSSSGWLPEHTKGSVHVASRK